MLAAFQILDRLFRQKTDVKLRSVIALLSCLGSFTSSVQAKGLYVDVGFGASQLRNGSALFPAIDDAPSFGLAMNFGILNNFSSYQSGLQIHIGFKHFYTSSGQGADTAGLHIPYGVIRFEFPRMYFTFGLSPVTITRFAPGIGIDQVNILLGSAALVEVGLLWRVTHFFHLSLEMSAQSLYTVQGFSPLPAAAASLQMRFFIIEPNAKGGRSGFDGWRYPFGIRLD